MKRKNIKNITTEIDIEHCWDMGSPSGGLDCDLIIIIVIIING